MKDMDTACSNAWAEIQNMENLSRNIKKRDYGRPKTKWVPLKDEQKLKV
jgi:hypothetical protein